MTEMNRLGEKKSETLPATTIAFWFFLCAGVSFALIASAGDCKPGGIVYCYGDERDSWWHPSKALGSLAFALILPMPHIALSLLHRRGRTITSIAKIAMRWHRDFAIGFGILLLVGTLAGQLNTHAV